jgi:hypothetical protein
MSNPLTQRKCRKCRKCGNFLRASRYFTCEACAPELVSLDDDFVYIEEATRWGSEDELLLPESEDEFFADSKDIDWDGDEIED